LVCICETSTFPAHASQWSCSQAKLARPRALRRKVPLSQPYRSSGMIARSPWLASRTRSCACQPSAANRRTRADWWPDAKKRCLVVRGPGAHACVSLAFSSFYARVRINSATGCSFKGVLTAHTTLLSMPHPFSGMAARATAADDSAVLSSYRAAPPPGSAAPACVPHRAALAGTTPPPPPTPVL
jgi:hypothetical protein